MDTTTQDNETNIYAGRNDAAVYYPKFRFRDRVMGGVPKNPAIVYDWIRQRMGLTQMKEIADFTIQTAAERGVTIDPDLPIEEIVRQGKAMLEANTNGFKFDSDGLYLERYQVMAMLREAVSVRLPYEAEQWGLVQAKKSPRSFWAEHVVVRGLKHPERLHLEGRKPQANKSEPDGVESSPGHIVGPQGPRSILTLTEWVERPTLEFELHVYGDIIPREKLDLLLSYAGTFTGLGARRSQGYGTFEVVRLERVVESDFRIPLRVKHPKAKEEPEATAV